jgi:hypothetical protein
VGQESNLQPAVVESGDFVSVWEYSPSTIRGYTTEMGLPDKIVGRLVGILDCESTGFQDRISRPKHLLNGFVWWPLITQPVLNVASAPGRHIFVELPRFFHSQVRHALSLERHNAAMAGSGNSSLGVLAMSDLRS